MRKFGHLRPKKPNKQRLFVTGLETVSQVRPRMNDNPSASIAMRLACDTIPASATTVTSRNWWARAPAPSKTEPSPTAAHLASVAADPRRGHRGGAVNRSRGGKPGGR